MADDFEAMVERAYRPNMYGRVTITAILTAAGVPELLEENKRLREGLSDIAYGDPATPSSGDCTYELHDGPRNMLDADCPGAICWAKRTLTPPITEASDA